MKKLLSLLLIFSMLLGMVACGGNSDGESLTETVAEETEQGFETEDNDTFYASGTPTAAVSINTNADYVLDDDQSLKVEASAAGSGVGIYDVLEMFMTPRNVGKLHKITVYVMPTTENAAFRLSVSKKGSDDVAAASYHFNLRANEWNVLTLLYRSTQENIDAGLVTVKVDQNVSDAVNAPVAEITPTFYVDKAKAAIFKEYAPQYTVYKTEDFESAKQSFSQYGTSDYAALIDDSKEYKMGSLFSGEALKVGAWNWNSVSGEKAMTLYKLAPDANGSFGARVKLNNLLPNDLRPYVGFTFKISAYVYMDGFADPAKTVSSAFGFMGDKKTDHLAYKSYEIKEREWTLVEFQLEITEDFLKSAGLTFDDASIKEHYPVRPFLSFGSHSSNYPSTVFIDNITVEYAMLNTNIGVTLPSIFADGMVLQRNKKVPVWGWGGNEGDTITATIGSYSAEAKVDANGDFYLELPEMKGATDQTLMIRNGNAAVTIKNVGIGEVWYCSGQSNMELKIGSTFDVSSIVANASKYDVRTFKVSVKAEYELQKDVTGGSWSQVTSSNASKVTAIGYIAAYQIQQALGVPVALIECYEGGSSAQAWLSYEKLFAADRETVYNDPSVLPTVRNNWGCEGRTIWQDYDHYWSIGKIYQTTKSEGTLIDGSHGSNGRRFAPTGLYNAMQGPLANYAIAGVMWYQGESQVNARLSSQYNYLQYDLIEQWREDFRDPELPVMLVQLAPYEAGHGRNFFEIRQIQIDTAKRMDNVGVICTAYEGTFDNKDVGGAIHPGTKVPVGNRMADTILATVYDVDMEYCGPLFERMEISGSKAILYFSHIESGLAIKKGDSKLTGFQISGDGVNFVDATATIEGDTLAVTASSVAVPVAVRYAYINVVPISGAPDTLGGNLENGEGKPAFPFVATLGDAEVHGAAIVDGRVDVEIWERGHNESSYKVTVKVGGTTKEYTASFETAGNCVIKTDIAGKSGEKVTVTLTDADGKTVETKTITAE